jgi:hypothetical protein
MISENEFADIVTEALAALFPHDPPRFTAAELVSFPGVPVADHPRTRSARKAGAG